MDIFGLAAKLKVSIASTGALPQGKQGESKMMKGKALLNQLHGAAVFKRRVRILARLMAQELHDAAQVLDVGTGDGSIAAEIGRLRPDVTITGVDVLVRPSTQIPVILFDGSHLPLGGQ